MAMLDETRLTDDTLWREVARTIEQLQKLVLNDVRIDTPFCAPQGCAISPGSLPGSFH